MEGPWRKRWLAIGVLAVLLIAGPLIALRYPWQPSVDDNDPEITHRFQLWVDSRSYEFSIHFDSYPSESSAADETTEATLFRLMYTVEVDDDNDHVFYIFDIPHEIVSMWFRVHVTSVEHSPTNPVIAELEMGITEAMTVGIYEMSFLMTAFEV